MAKKTGHRYQLIVIGSKDEKTIIPINNNSKELLATIDDDTLKFSNQEQFLTYLKTKGYFTFEPADIYISYRASVHDFVSGQRITIDKRLEVVYSDIKELAAFAKYKESYINMEHIIFRNLFVSFLNSIQNEYFYMEAIKAGVINKRLEELIGKYYFDNKALYEQKLMVEFSRYQVLRGYIIFMKAYQNKLNVNSPVKTNNPDRKQA
ncbi:MAG: hypothetical protein PHE54_01885, partial [Bacilli bacterium]|nr:hypothetical protein [Bacilli bacterium]